MIRHLNKRDVPSVVSIEDNWNTHETEDIDFGKVILKNSWAIDSFDLGEIAKSNAVTMVIENDGKIVGFFIYENQLLCVDLQHLSLDPKLAQEEQILIIVEVIEYLKKQEPESVIYYIRDRDEAHIRTVLPVFMKNGFTVSSARNHFDGNDDGWKCFCEIGPKKSKGKDKELTW